MHALPGTNVGAPQSEAAGAAQQGGPGSTIRAPAAAAGAVGGVPEAAKHRNLLVLQDPPRSACHTDAYCQHRHQAAAAFATQCSPATGSWHTCPPGHTACTQGATTAPRACRDADPAAAAGCTTAPRLRSPCVLSAPAPSLRSMLQKAAP